MSSKSLLLDLAAAGRVVSIRGRDVTVRGLSARAIARLLARFPALTAALAGPGISAAALLSLGPSVVAAITAAGLGLLDDEDAERAAGDLTAADQAALIDAVLAETVADDPAGFLQRLASLAARVGVEIGGQTSAG